MKKYAHIQDIVCQLSEDKTFRTFFTLYLMADSETERQQINNRFWRDAAELTEAEQQTIGTELTNCFLRLPSMASVLLEKVSAIAYYTSINPLA